MASYIEVLCINLIVFREIKVLLSNKDTLCDMVSHREGIEGSNDLPRKRYSWIFFRSALGISLG